MKKYREDGGSASSTGYSLSSAYGSNTHQSIGGGGSKNTTSTINNSLKKLSELEKLQLLQLQRTREKITKELEHVNQQSSSSSSTAMYPYNHDTTVGNSSSSNYDNNIMNRSMMTPKVSFLDNESIHSFKSMDIPLSSSASYHNTHSASSKISRNHRRQQHQLSSSLISPSSSSSMMYNDGGKAMMSRSVNNIKSGTAINIIIFL